MGWHKGMNITDDQGKKSVVYLKEKGVPFRTEQLSSAMKPKDKYPLIELKDRSVYDLILFFSFSPLSGEKEKYMLCIRRR